MSENHLPDMGKPVQTPPTTPPTTAPGTSNSWLELKNTYLERVQAEGFQSLPEPDSAKFPQFLAELNAKNPVLARELVTDTRRLRRGMDMPNAAASQRRTRKRDTRRFLLMKQTPDGRWVLDKQKAPMYGMMGLLTIGGLLTAIYAMPRLDGRGLVEAKSPPPTPVQETGVTPAPVTPDRRSQEALEQSREQLRQIRQERGVTTQTTTPKPSVPAIPSSKPQQSRGLTEVKAPPPPPAVPSPAPSRNVYTPVPPASTTARSVSFPTDSTPQIDRPYAPTSTISAPPAPVSVPTPERPTVTPLGAVPESQEPQQTPTLAPLPSVAVPSKVPSSSPDSKVSPPAATKPAQGSVAASDSPESTPSPVDPVAAMTATAPPASSDLAEQGVPFGGYVSDPPSPPDATSDLATDDSSSSGPAAYLRPASTRAAYSGMVYQKKPQAQAASPSAGSPSATAGMNAQEGVTRPETDAPPVAATTGAETPFGSNVTNANSKIGATGPFKPLQQVPAALLTGIRTPNGGSVPVVAMTTDGGSFIGVATVNAALARVDIQFRRFIAPDGKIHEIDALAYAKEGNGGLMQGIPANVEPLAPTLALDAVQNSANSLNTYVQNLAAAAAKTGNTTTINLGDGTTLSGPSVASLTQTLLGGLGSTFRMPENTQSIVRVATVKTNAQMVIIVGLGGGV